MTDPCLRLKSEISGKLYQHWENKKKIKQEIADNLKWDFCEIFDRPLRCLKTVARCRRQMATFPPFGLYLFFLLAVTINDHLTSDVTDRWKLGLQDYEPERLRELIRLITPQQSPLQ